ncbi:hypothetical protein PI172_2346 [Prevotella intermedia]|uniref:Uncharacterized protein n=1 Tax=Prevotella intermedia TaxID=28131 RepID=A0AAD1BJZ9_PREIN|nr:hypothetical protein PI172_2346 [Prevotella intermedia]
MQVCGSSGGYSRKQNSHKVDDLVAVCCFCCAPTPLSNGSGEV